MDYENLRASNGGGDAPLMKVQKQRLSGSTTINVDTTTNVPNKFVATYGDLGSDGFITAASARTFRGHLADGALIIDSFSPGNNDTGNTEGQVVVIKPNTDVANAISTLAQVAHNADGTIRTGSITNTMIAQQAITPDKLNLSKTVGSNGWTKYDYGTWQEYVKVFTAFGSGGSFGADSNTNALTEVSGTALPVGITNTSAFSSITWSLSTGGNAPSFTLAVESGGNGLYNMTTMPTVYIRNVTPNNVTLNGPAKITFVLKT